MKLFRKRGYLEYKHFETQKKFSEHLISIGEKFLWASIAVFISFFIKGESVSYKVILFTGSVLFLIGIWFRHEGLKSLDEILLAKDENIDEQFI